MKILVSIVIIAIVVLFCIGAVNSNYNCVTHLCGSLTHAINFVGDFLHTEMAGVNIVAKVFWGDIWLSRTSYTMTRFMPA